MTQEQDKIIYRVQARITKQTHVRMQILAAMSDAALLDWVGQAITEKTERQWKRYIDRVTRKEQEK